MCLQGGRAARMLRTLASAWGGITNNKSFCLRFLLTFKTPAGALCTAHLQSVSRFLLSASTSPISNPGRILQPVMHYRGALTTLSSTSKWPTGFNSQERLSLYTFYTLYFLYPFTFKIVDPSSLLQLLILILLLFLISRNGL